MKTRTLLSTVAAFGLATTASASLTPVFLYDADGGTGSGTAGTLAGGTQIIDQSTAGNNGTVGAGVGSFDNSAGNTIDTVEDDPFNVAGELSFSFTGANRINTNAIDLLTDDLIAANGGYTMHTWIKTTPDGLQQFLAFAGTDGLTINGDTLRTINHRGSTVNDFGAAGLLTDNEWHEVEVRFDTSGDLDGTAGSTDVIANLDGVYTVIVDGVVISSGETASTGTFGDTLDRNIGVGGHSNGFDGFTGLLYNPSVSLGVVPEPSSLALMGLGGFAMLRRRRNG